MNIIEKLKIGLTRNTRLNPFNESFLWGVGDGYTQYLPDNKIYVEEGYLTNPFVYSVVSQIATKVSSVPYYVNKVESKTQYRKLKSLEDASRGDYTISQYVQRSVLRTKALSKEDLPFPLERPNPNQTWSEFFALSEIFLKTTGNVYMYMLKPENGINTGVPIAIYLLPSQYTQIVIHNHLTITDAEDPVKSYIMISGRSYIEFSANDVIHIKYPNPDYGENGEHLYGISPLRSVLKNIESTNSGLDLNIKTLKNGGAFGFIHAKTQALTVDQAKEIKERLIEMNASPENLGKIAGVSAELGFTRISLTTDELKPFEYFSFDKETIYNALNWALDSGTRGDFGGTIAEIRKMRITDCILPDLKLIEEALNQKFIPLFKGYENTVMSFDVSELPEMQVDMDKLSRWLTEALDRGVITKNEYRTAIKYPEVDDKGMDELKI